LIFRATEAKTCLRSHSNLKVFFVRYALYFTPPANDPLTRTAAAWLGRDAFSQRLTELPAIDGIGATDVHDLTADPRRYGFHATLKAPFELAEGKSEADLLAAFDQFAASATAFEIDEIVLGRLGAFFALVPALPCETLRLFAQDCVSIFEPFRAPLSPEDIARRKPDELSANQRMNLMTWGYPYVLDDFRFHMTLTGQVPDAAMASMQAALEHRFESFLNRPLAIDHLALFVEPVRGAPFHALAIRPLGEKKTRKSA
jgi:putative phosphonate metabolism protein